ncbi:MAG: hypothetical protein HQK93_03150 [Nitrospirae bacterium]|nr:hypothetical protein [Nitrospirota bacterium]
MKIILSVMQNKLISCYFSYLINLLNYVFYRVIDSLIITNFNIVIQQLFLFYDIRK